MKYTIYARAFDKRNKTLGVGTNSYKKTHPIQKFFAKLVQEPYKEFLHAEIAAILKSNDQEIYSMQIDRFDKKGQPRLARPCPICMAALKAYNVKYIRYSTINGYIEECL